MTKCLENLLSRDCVAIGKNPSGVMLSGAMHLYFQSLAKARSFGYRLRMTLRHSLIAGSGVNH
jgi:hypothetical protein